MVKKIIKKGMTRMRVGRRVHYSTPEKFGGFRFPKSPNDASLKKMFLDS